VYYSLLVDGTAIGLQFFFNQHVITAELMVQPLNDLLDLHPRVRVLELNSTLLRIKLFRNIHTYIYIYLKKGGKEKKKRKD
jgi:hypothetical protein